jgi:hypothetical protein
VIAPNLKAPVALEGLVVVVVAAVVLALNATAAERSATLLVRAPRHPEVAQEEVTGVSVVVVVAAAALEAEEEATVILGAVKKHGASCLAALPEKEKGAKCSVFSISFKLHVRWGRPSVA